MTTDATSTARFSALRAHVVGGDTKIQFDKLTLGDLDDGEVVVKVAYSGVGYRDAMAACGIGKNVRTDRPCVLGVDLSGVVETSRDPKYSPGDPVVATSYGLGASHDGGYAEYARVPADWIVPLPTGLSLKEAMVIGGPGLTAALAIDRMECAGLTPNSGPVAVSGATGGVGSLAIDMLSSRGYRVAAITGKATAAEYLRSIGASDVIDRATWMQDGKAIGQPTWAGAVDTIGGDVLDMLAKTMLPHGRIAVCGMTAGYKLTTTVLPFILRSVDFLGINVGRAFSMKERLRIWHRAATDLKPKRLNTIVRPIPFSELPSMFDRFIDSKIVGRVLVEIGAEAIAVLAKPTLP